MPAPTALQRAPEKAADAQAQPPEPTPNALSAIPAAHDDTLLASDQVPVHQDDTQLAPMDLDSDTVRPLPSLFPPESSAATTTSFRAETRSVRVPPNRFSPLKREWPTIYPPLVEHLRLQVRMNLAKKAVELRTSAHTTDSGAVQKGADFIQAFCLGFDVADAAALLRLDDLYIQSFDVRDVKTLAGEHLSRAIGRIAGKDGKTKFAIENATRTRIVLADQKVHILGGFRNIGIAREAVVSLILGKQPGKVYGDLRIVAARMKERF